MSRKRVSGLNDLARLVRDIAQVEPFELARRLGAVDPDQLYDLYFQGPQKSRTIWKGTDFSSALALLDAFALLISIALPDLAEVKFEAKFSIRKKPGADPSAFEVRYVFPSAGTMRRIIQPAGNPRAASTIRPEVEDFER